MLAEGGNAVDAAIAATAAQGVVAPETCGIGGDLFALVHAPGWDRPKALNASGRAGSGADAEAVRRAGLGSIPADHPAAVTIPGCVDGWVALTELGRLSLAACLAPAIELARDGFTVSAEQAWAFARNAHRYAEHPAVAEFYPDGRPVDEGTHISRPRLARTLEAVAESGRAGFYEGIPGGDLVAELDGWVRPEDLTRVQAEWVDPIAAEVAGMIAWTIPPNSQGYLGPGSLAVFEMLDPPPDPDHPDWWHLLIEAYRCLAWERNDLVADPESAALPAHLLLDRERLARAAAGVDRDRAGVWPERMGREAGTAYLCAVDDDGLAVSVIQSNYGGTGSSFGAPRSGFLFQDRGSGFNLVPGHPNELRSGRRPLHTLSPTLWTEGERTRWLLGTRGGAVQPQLVAQVGARAILAGQDLTSAQGAARWAISDFGPHTPSTPSVEPGVDPNILDHLRSRGHVIRELERPQPGWGPVSIIEVRADRLSAAADPRVDTTRATVV